VRRRQGQGARQSQEVRRREEQQVEDVALQGLAVLGEETQPGGQGRSAPALSVSKAHSNADCSSSFLIALWVNMVALLAHLLQDLVLLRLS